MHSFCWQKIDPERNCYRFYIIRLQADLFSAWRVECAWGRLNSGRAQRKVRCFDDLSEAEDYRDKESLRRAKRGYALSATAA